MFKSALSFLLLLIICCKLRVVASAPYRPEPVVPAMFIFGDSVVDAGNNNRLFTIAQANHPPYGMSFPNKIATGRFSDGKVVPDLIAESLGLPLIPPFYGATLSDTTRGVNFASASSGILPETHSGGAIAMDTQIANFQSVRRGLIQRLGPTKASELISKSIFYINIANNDVNNAYQRYHGLPASLQGRILDNFEGQLRYLYQLGARKFVVVGLSAVGCIPMNQIGGHCALIAQSVARNYNVALDSLLQRLRRELFGSQIVRTNYYDLMVDVKTHPQRYGITNTVHGCCPVGAVGAGAIFCPTGSTHCNDPEHYMFFDGIHNTQRVYEIAAQRWWSGGIEYALERQIIDVAKFLNKFVVFV